VRFWAKGRSAARKLARTTIDYLSTLGNTVYRFATEVPPLPLTCARRFIDHHAAV
jgi:hypothetical protein